MITVVEMQEDSVGGWEKQQRRGSIKTKIPNGRKGPIGTQYIFWFVVLQVVCLYQLGKYKDNEVVNVTLTLPLTCLCAVFLSVSEC